MSQHLLKLAILTMLKSSEASEGRSVPQLLDWR